MLHKHLMQTIAVMLAAGSATAYGQDLPAPSFRMEPARTAPLELRTPVQQGETTARGDTTSYPVIATQTGANVLEVKNFLGYGQTVKLLMNRNHTYTCRSQVGLVEGNTAYYTRGDLVLNDKGQGCSVWQHEPFLRQKLLGRSDKQRHAESGQGSRLPRASQSVRGRRNAGKSLSDKELQRPLSGAGNGELRQQFQLHLNN